MYKVNHENKYKHNFWGVTWFNNVGVYIYIYIYIYTNRKIRPSQRID